MKNVFNEVRQAYSDLLTQGLDVPVYKEDVLLNETGDHVIIRVEDGNDRSHKSGFVTNLVVITEVVTVGINSVMPETAGNIDSQIKTILLPDVGSRTITGNGIQVTNIRAESQNALNEYDGTKRYYRIITRWGQRVSHT